MNVFFLCTQNSCRSQMAEGLKISNFVRGPGARRLKSLKLSACKHFQPTSNAVIR
ncbi:MAG: arsenate reductase/protein-tyrosine-phosphatase family protein [Dissulfurimicrobium sp.]